MDTKIGIVSDVLCVAFIVVYMVKAYAVHKTLRSNAFGFFAAAAAWTGFLRVLHFIEPFVPNIRVPMDELTVFTWLFLMIGVLYLDKTLDQTIDHLIEMRRRKEQEKL